MKQEKKQLDIELDHTSEFDPPGEIHIDDLPKNKKCNMFKRMLLLLTLLPLLAFVPSHQYDVFRSLYFITPASSVAIYILLLNFPCIVARVHSRPLYYDDLEDDRYIDPAIKRRFQFIFVIILQITLTLIISGMIYYYYDRFHITRLSKIEIFGVLGGFISLLLKIENLIGKSVMVVLNLWKKWSPYLESELERKRTRKRSSSFAMAAEV
jgi:hypothetical protein